jgi:hypothetical protein
MVTMSSLSLTQLVQTRKKWDRYFFEVRYEMLRKNFADNFQFSATLTYIAAFNI